jgi:hypothetical protein
MSSSEEFPGLPDLPNLFDDAETPPAVGSLAAQDPKAIGSASSKALVVLGLVCAALIVAGYVLPWIVVDKGAYGGRRYEPLELPIGNFVGITWTVFLTMLAVLGWMRRSRWILLLGSAFALITALVMTMVWWVMHLVPRLMPLWIIPKAARGYVPDVSIGDGATVAVIASVLLLAWFVLATFARPVPASPRPLPENEGNHSPPR